MYKVNAKGVDLNLTGEYDPPIKKTEYCSIQYFDVICIFFLFGMCLRCLPFLLAVSGIV